MKRAAVPLILFLFGFLLGLLCLFPMSSRPPLFSSWLNSSYCAAIRILTFFSSVVILSEFCNLYPLKKGRCPVGRLPLRGLFTQP